MCAGVLCVMCVVRPDCVHVCRCAVLCGDIAGLEELEGIDVSFPSRYRHHHSPMEYRLIPLGILEPWNRGILVSWYLGRVILAGMLYPLDCLGPACPNAEF